jgi:endonuclease YncB( thermonuclease family)
MPDLQQQAQRQGRGLWADADPVEPWVWRYQCWRQKQC